MARCYFSIYACISIIIGKCIGGPWLPIRRRVIGELVDHRVSPLLWVFFSLKRYLDGTVNILKGWLNICSLYKIWLLYVSTRWRPDSSSTRHQKITCQSLAKAAYYRAGSPLYSCLPRAECSSSKRKSSGCCLFESALTMWILWRRRFSMRSCLAVLRPPLPDKV